MVSHQVLPLFNFQTLKKPKKQFKLKMDKILMAEDSTSHYQVIDREEDPSNHLVAMVRTLMETLQQYLWEI